MYYELIGCPTFEHKAVRFYEESIQAIIQELDALGRDGWELATMESLPNYQRIAWLRRSIRI